MTYKMICLVNTREKNVKLDLKTMRKSAETNRERKTKMSSINLTDKVMQVQQKRIKKNHHAKIVG